MTMKLLRLEHQTHLDERHEQAEGLVVARGDADAFNLWAGQAHSHAVERPAAETVRALTA